MFQIIYLFIGAVTQTTLRRMTEQLTNNKFEKMKRSGRGLLSGEPATQNSQSPGRKVNP